MENNKFITLTYCDDTKTYIKADAIEQMYEEKGITHVFTNSGTSMHIKESINEILVKIGAEIEERKVGKWLSAEEYALKIGAEVTEDIKNSLYKFCPFCDQTVFMERNYCPNCGAEMRGESNNG